jgi:hypothetical protein
MRKIIVKTVILNYVTFAISTNVSIKRNQASVFRYRTIVRVKRVFVIILIQVNAFLVLVTTVWIKLTVIASICKN